MMDFYIEYEIPPFRSIDTETLKASSEEQAIEYFKLSYPGAKIRKIESYGYSK